MSLAFSQTSSPYKGIIQRCEVKLFGQDSLGRISGDSQLLGIFTSAANVALDAAYAQIFEADGRWQFDDQNHTDYPIITTDLVANQRDYTFTTDENSNLILEVEKVAILPSATDTEYDVIAPVDIQTRNEFTEDDTSITGIPYMYDKNANGIFLHPIPEYSATNGLKIYISREGSYFQTSDTTKKPGFAGLFHDYIVYHICYHYAIDNNLQNVNGFLNEMQRLEDMMIGHYSKRSRDEQDVLSPLPINYM